MTVLTYRLSQYGARFYIPTHQIRQIEITPNGAVIVSTIDGDHEITGKDIESIQVLEIVGTKTGINSLPGFKV